MTFLTDILVLFCIAQEKATIGFDDDVKITPFNIDEELEDGHYDETGCFRWNKKDVSQWKYIKLLVYGLLFIRKKKSMMLGSMISIGPM